MIGTTRSRVSFFMNRFRKLGLIEYNGRIRVHRSLLNVILHDQMPGRRAAAERYFRHLSGVNESSLPQSNLYQIDQHPRLFKATLAAIPQSIPLRAERCLKPKQDSSS